MPIQNASDSADLPQTAGDERRNAFRYPCRTDNSCLMIVSQRHESRWARPRDISMRGLGLSVSGPLNAGALTLVEFSSQGGTSDLTLVASVVHASDLGDGTWAMGCRYDNVRGDLGPAEREQLQTLMQQSSADQPVTKASQHRLREALRIPCENPLREPLRSLRKLPRADPQRQRHFDLLYDLLLAARGNLRLECCQLDLAYLAARSLQLARTCAPGNRPWLVQDFPLESLSVSADPARLEWALARLVEAVAQQSTNDAPVALVAARVAGAVSLRIGGSASNLDQAEFPSIAELLTPQSTAVDPQFPDWDDIEIALARRIVELHGGELYGAVPQGSRGSYLGLRLPLS